MEICIKKAKQLDPLSFNRILKIAREIFHLDSGQMRKTKRKNKRYNKICRSISSKVFDNINLRRNCARIIYDLN